MKRKMTWWTGAVVLVLLGALPLAGAVPRASKTEKIIQGLEARRFKAMVEADVATLDSLLAPDLSYSHSSGWTQTKTEFMDSLRHGELKYAEIQPNVLEVRVYGNTALVTGRASVKVKSRGQDVNNELRFLDVYVKRQGRWQMVAWQSCRLAQ